MYLRNSCVLPRSVAPPPAQTMTILTHVIRHTSQKEKDGLSGSMWGTTESGGGRARKASLRNALDADI